MTTRDGLAIGTAMVFVAIAAWHYYWALGGNVGLGLALPQARDGKRLFTPGRGTTFVVATAFASVSLLILADARYVTLAVPQQALRTLVVVVAVLLLLRAVGDFRYVGAFKRVRGTRFARYDTRWYSPLSLALAVALVLVAR